MDHIFRGQNLGEKRLQIGFKPDWKLIHRDEEEKFTSFRRTPAARVLPTSMDFPPLLGHMVKIDKERAGRAVSETPSKLPIVLHSKTQEKLKQEKMIESSEPSGAN